MGTPRRHKGDIAVGVAVDESPLLCRFPLTYKNSHKRGTGDFRKEEKLLVPEGSDPRTMHHAAGGELLPELTKAFLMRVFFVKSAGIRQNKKCLSAA